MSEVYEKLMKCYKSVREKTDFVPEAALILGSGLGDYADDLKIEASVNYADIEGFPVSTVKGHKGRFVFAHVEGVFSEGRNFLILKIAAKLSLTAVNTI